MEILIFFGIGWDYLAFNCLLVVTIASTVGLCVAALGIAARQQWAKAVVFVGCLYIPVAFSVLTFRDFTPPAGWWPLLPLSLATIVLALTATPDDLRIRDHR